MLQTWPDPDEALSPSEQRVVKAAYLLKGYDTLKAWAESEDLSYYQAQKVTSGTRVPGPLAETVRELVVSAGLLPRVRQEGLSRKGGGEEKSPDA